MLNKYTDFFAGVIDQDDAVSQLVSAFEGKQNGENTLANTWMITGSPGSGRENIAFGFAAMLVCDGSEKVNVFDHVDVQIVKTETLSIGVDDIKEVMQLASTYPAKSKYRVFLIDDADRMTDVAQNALLKSLEEPANFTIWILLAPSPESLLPTIQSRSRILQLKTPSEDSIEQLLISNGVDEVRAKVSARLSGGHIGVARHLASDDVAMDARVQIAEHALSIRTVYDAVSMAAWLIDMAKIRDGEIEMQYEQKEHDLRKQLGFDEVEKIPPRFKRYFKALEDEKLMVLKRSVRDYVDIALEEIMLIYRDIAYLQLGGNVENLVNLQVKDLLEKYASSRTEQDVMLKIDAIRSARKKIAQNCLVNLTLEALFVQCIIPERVLI